MTVQHIPITDREEWLAMRRQDITASDVPAVCGVDPRRTVLQVYAEKLGLVSPQADSQIMRRGRWLESAFVDALADIKPQWETRRAKVYLRDETIRLGATPDMVAVDPERDGVGIVQCKVVSRPVFVRDWRDGDDGPITVPLGYQLQTLTEAMLAGATWAVVAALVIDTFTADLVVSPVELHVGAWDRVRATVARFWTDVELGRQPQVDFERDGEIVRELYRHDDGTEIDLSGDNRVSHLVEELERAKAQAKELAAHREAIETEIKAKLGTHSYGRLADGRYLSWREQHRKGYEVKPSSARVLKIVNSR